jgi:toxin CcdB
MARFDVYRNPRRETAREVPFLLDVQSDLLEGLGTRVVVPLRAVGTVKQPVTRLNPVFKVGDAKVFMDTPQLAGIPANMLRKPVLSLGRDEFEIRNALDFLFAGV